jgi:ferric-dicitrate binding protein FerR (iron transport regulator)
MNDRLVSLLRQHDPATGKSLNDFDRTRILHRALQPEPVKPTRRVRSFQLALAAVMLFVVAIVAFRREPPAPPRVAARQIQYATPGGTRIVWTLDPKFHM